MDVPREVALMILEHYREHTIESRNNESDISEDIIIPSEPITRILIKMGHAPNILDIVFYVASDIKSAKRLRLVNKSLAAAFSPLDICRLIGGVFGRKKYGYMIRANYVLWNRMARDETLCARMAEVLARMDQIVAADKTHYAWVIHNYKYLFMRHPWFIFENKYMYRFITAYSSRVRYKQYIYLDGIVYMHNLNMRRIHVGSTSLLFAT